MKIPAGALLLLLGLAHCGIRSVSEGETKIQNEFLKTAKNSKASKTASLLVHSDRLKLHIRAANGFAKGEPAAHDQPFHVASIGKMFTAVLILQLVEEKKLALDDSVLKILGAPAMNKLFEFEGVDYANQVTIEHLLSHTSGAADYFESTDGSGRSVLKEILRAPDRFWTPSDMLDFSRLHQKAHGRPGEKFLYSDTGYVLLGLVVEKVTGETFEKVLHSRIFNRLGMKHSNVHLRSEPAVKSSRALSTMMLGSTDVTEYRSVSADWSGGGIVSTTEDLLLFQQALVKGSLISEKSALSMRGNHKFMEGIYYGSGLMTVRFADMSALMPQTPELHGHSGLLSTLLFYSPEYDAHIIANLGSTDDVETAFEMMFWLMQTLKEIQTLSK